MTAAERATIPAPDMSRTGTWGNTMWKMLFHMPIGEQQDTSVARRCAGCDVQVRGNEGGPPTFCAFFAQRGRSGVGRAMNCGRGPSSRSWTTAGHRPGLGQITWLGAFTSEPPPLDNHEGTTWTSECTTVCGTRRSCASRIALVSGSLPTPPRDRQGAARQAQPRDAEWYWFGAKSPAAMVSARPRPTTPPPSRLRSRPCGTCGLSRPPHHDWLLTLRPWREVDRSPYVS